MATPGKAGSGTRPGPQADDRGRATFVTPLQAGVPAERFSTLAGAEVKQGRTGEMLFVTVRSEIRQNDKLCLIEEQDVVYRSRRATVISVTPCTPSVPGPPPSDAAWQLLARPGPPLLFRFSALTANAHHIHYDARMRGTWKATRTLWCTARC